MKKFLLAFFLMVIALASALIIYPSHASGTANITIDSTTQEFPSANVGDTIQDNIIISGVQGLWAWDIVGLSFNQTNLNITSVTEGPFLKAEGQSLFIWTSNSAASFAKGVIPEITDTLLQFTGASGDGVLATLTFKVLSLGTSQIAFNGTTLDSSTNLGTMNSPNYQKIPCTTTNVDITVGPNASNPTNSPTPTGSSSTQSPTLTAKSSPTATTNVPLAPEFPAISILILVIVVATISTTLIVKKAQLIKK
jgi:hypothetical protein